MNHLEALHIINHLRVELISEEGIKNKELTGAITFKYQLHATQRLRKDELNTPTSDKVNSLGKDKDMLHNEGGRPKSPRPEFLEVNILQLAKSNSMSREARL